MYQNGNGLKEFEVSILKRLENKGIDAFKMEIGVKQFIDDNHRCCLWYGGAVVEVAYRGFVFSLEARGDVEGVLLDEHNEVLCRVHDRENGGAFYGEMKGALADDAAVHAAELAGRLDFENNNWFEIFIQMPDGEWSGVTEVCDHDDLKEALVQMVEDMDYLIDEVAKGLDSEKDMELLGRLALEHFGYDAELAMEDESIARHLDTFITGYRDGVGDIDMDFWVQYEELLGEKMSYEEYIFVDGLYDGDPLELIDMELTEEEKAEFAGLRAELLQTRKYVADLVDYYKERWTPDTNDTIFQEAASGYGEGVAKIVVAELEREYKCWFDVDKTLEEAKVRASEGKKHERMLEEMDL